MNGAWTGASGKQRTQTGTSGAETRDWSIRGRYGLEGSGQHQGEEVAAARRKGKENTNKSKMQRRATAEAGTGSRHREGMEEGGGGRGRAKTQRGRLGGQNKEGAIRSKAKQWGTESAEEYPRG